MENVHTAARSDYLPSGLRRQRRSLSSRTASAMLFRAHLSGRSVELSSSGPELEILDFLETWDDTSHETSHETSPTTYTTEPVIVLFFFFTDFSVP